MGTTSEKLTYLNTTKGKIKDSINLTGANITTEPFRQYSTKLEDAYIDIINNGTDTLYNNFPKVSGEGTSLTLNNTYQAPMRNNLKGNTSQTGTSTTSSIPVNVVSGDNEILIQNANLWSSEWEQGDITNTGADSSTNNRIRTKDYIPVIPNQHYAIKRTIHTSYIQVRGYDENKNFVGAGADCVVLISGNTSANPMNTGDNCVIYPKEGISYLRFVDNSNDLSTKYMMIKGDTIPTDYVPYEIDTYNIDLPVENLLDLTQVTMIGSGSTQSNIQTNSLTLNGKSAWSNTYFFITNTFKNTNYTASCKAFSSIARKSGLSIYGANDTSGSGMTSINGVTEDMSANVSKTYINSFNSGNYEYLAIRFWTNATGTSLDSNVDLNISEIMLEVGTKANTYTPFGTTPIELCKIGNYQDYFYKDSDKWYLHKEIVSFNFNGTENWSGYTDVTGSSGTIAQVGYNVNYYHGIIFKNREGFSNRFQVIADYSATEHLVIAGGLKVIYIQVAKSRLSEDSLNGFKNWLSNNNTSFYGVLDTPTNTEITDTALINQLEEFYQAQSKNNQTNISQINNDLPFIISASALKKG